MVNDGSWNGSECWSGQQSSGLSAKLKLLDWAAATLHSFDQNSSLGKWLQFPLLCKPFPMRTVFLNSASWLGKATFFCQSIVYPHCVLTNLTPDPGTVVRYQKVVPELADVQ